MVRQVAAKAYEEIEKLYQKIASGVEAIKDLADAT